MRNPNRQVQYFYRYAELVQRLQVQLAMEADFEVLEAAVARAGMRSPETWEEDSAEEHLMEGLARYVSSNGCFLEWPGECHGCFAGGFGVLGCSLWGVMSDWVVGQVMWLCELLHAAGRGAGRQVGADGPVCCIAALC